VLRTDQSKFGTVSQRDVLVVGADGILGCHLVELLEQTGCVVWRTSRRSGFAGPRCFTLDLAGEAADWRLPLVSPYAAVICAAVPAVAACEADPQATARVNVTGTVTLARLLAAKGVFTVFPSSNMVFDGTRPNCRSDEPVCPCTEYGCQKALAEQQLSSLSDRVAIVRFTKILSPDMPLITGWIEALRSGHEVYPFSDMVMAPVPVTFAAEVLRQIAERRLPDVFHVSGDRDVSYAEVARHLASRLGADPALVVPVSSESRGLPARAIAKHTTLDSSRIRSILGMQPPSVWEAIDETFGLVGERTPGRMERWIT